MLEYIRPALHKCRYLVIKSLHLLRSILQPARLGLIMMEYRIGIIYHELAQLSDLQAVVDIVECDHQLLGQPADRIVQGFLRQHARRRDRAVVLRRQRPVEVAVLIFIQPYKCMPRYAAEAHDHSGMLYRIVLVQQAAARHSHVVTLAVAQHLPDGIGIDHLDVVVHQQQILA